MTDTTRGSGAFWMSVFVNSVGIIQNYTFIDSKITEIYCGHRVVSNGTKQKKPFCKACDLFEQGIESANISLPAVNILQRLR